MIYQYRCDKCNEVIEASYPAGKAAKTVKCKCGKTCERYYGEVAFILKGAPGGWPSKAGRFKREQTIKNADAGKRMRKERGSTVSAKRIESAT